MDIFWILFLIILFPIYVRIISYLNVEFFMSGAKWEEISTYLETYGYELVDFKETKKHTSLVIEENLFEKFYTFKKHYLINAKSNSDRSDKKYHLILKKTWILFKRNRAFYFFEL